MQRTGTLTLVDTSLHIWEETVNEPEFEERVQKWEILGWQPLPEL